MKRIPTSEIILLVCALASIILSLVLIFILDEPKIGIVLAFWPPTIIGFINYMNSTGNFK